MAVYQHVMPKYSSPCSERPLNEQPIAVYDHFFIHGSLSHANRPVSNDLLADATSDLYFVTKPHSLPCPSDQITN